MTQVVRVVYEHGHLGRLNPIDLAEGQEIQLMTISERERARAVLWDIFVHYEPTPR